MSTTCCLGDSGAQITLQTSLSVQCGPVCYTLTSYSTTHYTISFRSQSVKKGSILRGHNASGNRSWNCGEDRLSCRPSEPCMFLFVLCSPLQWSRDLTVLSVSSSSVINAWRNQLRHDDIITASWRSLLHLDVKHGCVCRPIIIYYFIFVQFVHCVIESIVTVE